MNRTPVQDIFAALEPFEPRVKKPLLHPIHNYRSLFVSDLHLGTEGSRAEDFVEFLRHVRTQYLFLNGDIFDCWELRIWKFRELERFLKKERSLTAPPSDKQSHITALRKLLKQVDRKTRVVYIPGNHDEILRDYTDSSFGNLLIMPEAVHRTADDRHFLVTHGDVFDLFIRHHRLTSIMGTHANEFLTSLSVKVDRWRQNKRVNHLMEALGLTSHWSLSEAIKRQADKSICGQVYENSVLSHLFNLNADSFTKKANGIAQENDYYLDGIVGSHTHITKERVVASPLDKKTKEPKGPPIVTYLNTGHWTGRGLLDEEIEQRSCPAYSCTLVAEEPDGKMVRLRWVPDKGLTQLTSVIQG